MMTFIQAGENITVTSPIVAVAGAGVKIGSLFGIANNSAQIGEPLVLVTVGVFEIDKESTDAMTVGAPVYWKDSTSTVTTTASGNTKIGVAVTAAGNPSGQARVRLNGTF